MNFRDLLAIKPGRWPKKGDLPFKPASDPDAAGLLAKDHLTRTVSIMDGFMIAGSTLAEQVLKDRVQRYDLVYPMLFCYRHAIEAGLKWLILYESASVVKPNSLDSDHDLLKLWKYCRRIFEAYGDRVTNEEVEAMEKIIKQFHEWDKSGIAFRYASTKKGEAVNFRYFDIDIKNLKDVMVGVANFFTGYDGWLTFVADA